MIALVREVSPGIAYCELSHLDRAPIDPRRATRQHNAYQLALTEAGCRLKHLPPIPEHPDGVFVEDTAVVLDELAVITRPGAESRREEVDTVRPELGRHRPLVEILAPGTLDGGDVLVTGRTLYVGTTPRSNADGIAQLAALVGPAGYAVYAAPVRGCLHLKSAVTSLGENTLLINPAWTDAAVFEKYRLIEVHPTEPFAGNALRIGGTVIHAQEFPRTRERLRQAGFRVRPVEASELAKAEGGVTCCSLIFEPGKV